MGMRLQEVLVYTRPNGTMFTVNVDDGALASLLATPENVGAVGVKMTQPTLDYGDYNTFAGLYSSDLANAGLAAGTLQKSAVPPNIPGSMTPVQQTTRNLPPSAPTFNDPKGATVAGFSMLDAVKGGALVFIGLWLLRRI